jgi:hypothetical protein
MLLLPVLIAGLHVNGKTDIQPTYCITTPDDASFGRVRPTSGK